MIADARSRLVELSHRAENGEFCLNCREGACPSNEILAVCDRALKPTVAYSGGTSTDHLVPAGGSGQEMLALRPDAAPNMSHRQDSSGPNRLTDETSGPDDLDAYLERRRKRTDLNSDVVGSHRACQTCGTHYFGYGKTDKLCPNQPHAGLPDARKEVS